MTDEQKKIGDTVHIRHAPDIEGTVTAIVHRAGGYIEYEVTWVANGEIKTAWLTPLMLAEKEQRIPYTGFKPKAL